MKKIGRLFLVLAVAAVSLFATGCSFKIVGWKDHIGYKPEYYEAYQKIYDSNYEKIYDKNYQNEYDKALKSGAIKGDGSSEDAASEAEIKDSVIKMVEAATEAEVNNANLKNRYKVSHFWSWFLLHILFLPLIVIIGLIVHFCSWESQSLVYTRIDNWIVGADFLFGAGIYIWHFFAQNVPYYNHVILCQLIIVQVVEAVFQTILHKEGTSGSHLRAFTGTFCVYLAAVFILILNVCTKSFVIPMCISAAVWAGFIVYAVLLNKKVSKEAYERYAVEEKAKKQKKLQKAKKEKETQATQKSQIENMIKAFDSGKFKSYANCPICGEKSGINIRICPKCGIDKNLPLILCPGCLEVYTFEKNYCPACGYKVFDALVPALSHMVCTGEGSYDSIRYDKKPGDIIKPGDCLVYGQYKNISSGRTGILHHSICEDAGNLKLSCDVYYMRPDDINKLNRESISNKARS